MKIDLLIQFSMTNDFSESIIQKNFMQKIEVQADIKIYGQADTKESIGILYLMETKRNYIDIVKIIDLINRISVPRDPINYMDYGGGDMKSFYYATMAGCSMPTSSQVADYALFFGTLPYDVKGVMMAGGYIKDGVVYLVKGGKAVTLGAPNDLGRQVANALGKTTSKSVGSKTLFRGDKGITPQEAFKNGISPNGTGENLLDHVSGVKPGNFVSTSEDSSLAQIYAGNIGKSYVYEINTSNYIDVNKALGYNSLYPVDLEFSIPRGVSPSSIRGAWVIQDGVWTGEFIPNLGFIGGY